LYVLRPFFLGAMHGNAGGLEQRIDVELTGIHGNADAGGHEQLSAFDHDGVGKRGVDLVDDGNDLLDIGDVFENDREFVAAETGNAVDLAQRSPQQSGDGLQEQVPCGVTQRVVDFLERIEIEKHHREHSSIALAPRRSTQQLVLQQIAIGQPGQRVVMRQIDEPFLGFLAFRDVANVADKHRHGLRRDRRYRQLDRKFFAIGAQRRHLEAFAEDGALAGREIMRKPALMLGAKTCGHDQPVHPLAEHRLA
jgi:hypothetical protein